MLCVSEWVHSGDHEGFLYNYASWQKQSHTVAPHSLIRPIDDNETDLYLNAIDALSKHQIAMRYALATLTAIEKLKGRSKDFSQQYAKAYLQKALNESLRPSEVLLSQNDSPDVTWILGSLEP